jgi:general secretion pathway protein H
MVSKGKNRKANSNQTGWINIYSNSNGYTLIELIVVIALLGIVLLFTVPRFHDTLFLDDTKKSSRWIIGKVQALKESAIRNQKQYVLHIDLDTNRIWETDPSMSPESLDSAALDAYALPGNVTVIDVEFPVSGTVNGGRANITFYKAGYTDKALIHIQDDDEQLSFLIEPFLMKVKLFDKYASFED